MTWFVGLDLLDGGGLRHDMALRIEGRVVSEVAPRDGRDGIDLSERGARALVSPGLIDLQVNGGAGRMIGAGITGPQILDIADAHWATGTGTIVPTLISDSRAVTAEVIEAVADAVTFGAGQIPGLHLEGPHLAVPGAHDPAMLRPMEDADVDLYLRAHDRIGALIVTLAPEMVGLERIRALSAAGIVVSLGHTACDYDTARAAFDAGARMVTHLYNAMSGLHHRAPGLVGAALDRGVPYGLIADGVHVHPAAIRVALSASRAAVLVSDAMAVAGSAASEFRLAGRRVLRAEGRLTLEDGTLAGADLTLVQAVENLARWTQEPLEALIPMAFDGPWRALLGVERRVMAPAPARLLIWRDGRAEARIDGDRILPLRR